VRHPVPSPGSQDISISSLLTVLQLIRAPLGGAILRIWPQPDGVRAVFEDEARHALLFSAVNDQSVELPGFEGRLDAVLWDAADGRVFVASDGAALYAYLFTLPLPTAPSLQLLCRTPLPATHAPVAVLNGAVACRLKNGALDTILLDSHRALQGGGGLEPGAGLAGGSGPAAKGALQKR
jgi:WD repeat-containing protein 19